MIEQTERVVSDCREAILDLVSPKAMHSDPGGARARCLATKNKGGTLLCHSGRL
jgi:hypothetical protein